MAETQQNLVQFKTGTAIQFSASTKDESTLYFITDTHQIYKGDTPYGSCSVLTVDSLPTNGVPGTFYVNSGNKSVQFYDGSNYHVLVLPISTGVNGSSTNDTLATSKAVYDAISGAVDDLDVDQLVGRVASLESSMTTVQGVANKNKQDIEALSPVVATHTTDISGLKTTVASKANASDVYTKSQTDTAINTAVANSGHITREVVASLDAVTAPSDKVIYLVGPAADGSGNQFYEEFMYVNNRFEKVGDTKVSLDGYVTETALNTTLAPYAKKTDLNPYATTASVDTKLEAYTTTADLVENYATKTYVGTEIKKVTDGLGTAASKNVEFFATAAQGQKADKAVENVTEGTTNGTISVKKEGTTTQVPVHGLGSAAFVATETFATAEQGALAASALQKANITSGATNGTIAVKGTDVAVKGLGSMAYEDKNNYVAKSDLVWKSL